MWLRTSSFALACTLAVHSAQAQCPPQGRPCWEIALYADADCSSCNLNVPMGESRDFYVKANSNNDIGIVSAEFRITGLPAGWLHTSVPNMLAILQLGDPLNGVGQIPNGCYLGFLAPQEGDCVLLYRITLFATSEVHDVELRVEARNPPSHADFDCPSVVYLCPPCSVSCALGGVLYINSVQDCTVAVRAGTWTAVKRLYE